jgi:polysaccharide export outer membrane protein
LRATLTSVQPTPSRRTFARSLRRKAALLLAPGAALALLAGCEVDSFIDPSVIGRWEWTPTQVPILESIATIEDSSGETIEYADPTEEDLIPVIKPYRFGPGDRLKLTLYDVVQLGTAENYERSVDQRGNIEIPQLGSIYIVGLNEEQARQAIEERMRSRLGLEPPLAVIEPQAQRDLTFTIMGAVDQPGPYFIPSADYRLLEAITAGGRFDSSLDWVHVIRNVPLSDDEGGLRPAPAPGAEAPPQTPTTDGKSLIDLIDTLSKPAGETKADQPPSPSAEDVPKSPGMRGAPAVIGIDDVTTRSTRRAKPVASPGTMQPAVPLPESSRPRATPAPALRPASDTTWVFLNGKWQQIRTGSSAQPVAPAGEPARTRATQRVIRVPLKALLEGRREYNIVIRPKDVIRIPPAPSGVVYVGGQVARPGPYNLPPAGRLTLERAINAAGGLNNIAIPSRVDLTRMTGPDRQATIRLDLGAIAERTQPDIFLKPDDLVNVGTNFWAYPLAVIRNGFRANYGFGTIVDRNFGSDVFGLPPESRRGTLNF